MKLKFSNNKKSLENICRAKYGKDKLKNTKSVKVEIVDLGNGYGKFIRK